MMMFAGGGLMNNHNVEAFWERIKSALFSNFVGRDPGTKE
jgi:hypothetical protein